MDIVKSKQQADMTNEFNSAKAIRVKKKRLIITFSKKYKKTLKHKSIINLKYKTLHAKWPCEI